MTTEELSAKLEAALVQLRAVEAERDGYRASFNAELDGAMAIRLEYGAQEHETFKMFIDRMFAQLSALRAELQRKDAALKIYQARAHRNANSTCDGCPFAVAERDVNWADRDEGYYTCGLDNKERWGEDPACPDALYKEPPCPTA